MKNSLLHFFKKPLFVAFFLFSLLFSSDLYAQKAIQLTNKKTGKKLKPIVEGTRVIYYHAPVNGRSATRPIKGILSEITPTTITVNGVTVNITDLVSFGPKKSGSGFGSALLTGFGTALIAGSIKEQTQDAKAPCPRCTVVKDAVPVERTLLFTSLGIGLDALGIKSAIKNSPRNLKKWEIQIIDMQ
ncbi:hypothetical protein [Adhaeribacter soli]|uniref:Uncharacterized protein n=1 Tax=Adhaeribacter soli TaxID=2607655 RepID=A0A5N1J731_9BACT|nr:hypothetical protein [Adhaeribacter soli]KAA9340610.1 hypothetical protein F0P94_04055 [Adhaeribacter soli]